MYRLSYSQIYKHFKCPYSWALHYKSKIKIYNASLAPTFGTIMHETIQHYLQIMYDSSIKLADELKINEILSDNIVKTYNIEVDKNEGKQFATEEDLMEMYMTGIEIVKDFKKRKKKYFGKRGVKLIGIELPLHYNITDNIQFYGKLDIVIEEIDKIYIRDFKTSYYGWKDNKKKDLMTRSQLQLYKYFYSKEHNIPLDNIDVDFIILKKNIFENCDWPQPRVQQYTPPSGKNSINKVVKLVDNFIDDCLNEDGSIKDKEFKATPSVENCKWCEYKHTMYCKCWK